MQLFSDTVVESIPDDLPIADEVLAHHSTPILPTNMFNMDEQVEVVDWGADEVEIVGP